MTCEDVEPEAAMTPEQRVDRLFDCSRGVVFMGMDARAEIAKAIRAAVAAEREACAQVAERRVWREDLISQVARNIAAAIRERP